MRAVSSRRVHDLPLTLDRGTALVVSLKFNPGHFSHLVANYRLLEEAGFTPYLYVHRAFNAMDPRNEFRKVNSATDLSGLAPVRLAVFWFPSLKNVVEVVRLRLRWRSCIVYVLHEPFESFQRYRANGLRATRIWAINLVNIVVLLLSHAVILPSGSALRRYEERYGWLRRRYSLVPLLFDDEAGPTATPIGKRYIAYIGTVAPDHAFDRFAEFAHKAMSEGWFPELKFAIATSSTIPATQLALLQPHVDAGRLVVTSAHALSTDEINSFYRGSVVVWNAYNRSMQSGVLPKAYMFGAAVISLMRNANEYVEDGVTGILIDDNKDVQAIRIAVQRILDRRDAFFSACRRAFLVTFYYRNRLTIFDSIVNRVGSSRITRND
jgi:glycosyltransferase involved in cell wall biosynthesis